MANAHDMVYILSKDYWGFDPSTRDDSLNFYTNVWTLPKTQYDSMSDEDDRRKLYRCALFYVVDKTDNHGFTPIAMMVAETLDTRRVASSCDRLTLRLPPSRNFRT